ncbi:MAG: hypothetical protein WD894_00555 [Pirellulales bacterium]
MKRRIVLSLALLAGLSLFASANTAQAFNLFGRGHGCAEPSCCAPEPSCCDPCAPRHRGLLAGLFQRHRHAGCCDTGCDVGCAEPACAAPVEAACCAPEPTCCEPACGRKHRGLFRGLFHRHRHAGCCDTGCDVGCAEPACAAPVEVGCCAPEPTCCAPARRHGGLFRGLFHRHHAGCCDTGCDVGCAEPTCYGG